MSRPQHRAPRPSHAAPARGFTLIEFAVVAALVAMLVSALVVPLATQSRERRIAQAQRALDEIRQALIGYAEAQQPGPLLPCPDKTDAPGEGVANDGIEDRIAASGNCVTYEGNVPWATLGTPAADPWGTRYRYAVSRAYADRNGVTPTTWITLATQGSLWVCNGAPADITASACAPGTPITQVPTSYPIAASWSDPNAAAAVIVSHGANAWGGMSATTNLLLTAPPGSPSRPDEVENGGGDARIFVAREPSEAGSARGEFDDIVTWISPHILKNRLAVAGRLP